MTWLNSDGLFVKFGKEEGVSAKGGGVSTCDDRAQVISFTVTWDQLTASTQILGATSVDQSGSIGVVLPKGMYIEEIEIIAEQAFTSSGSIGASTFVLGLIRSDRSTELDYDGLTTASFVGSLINANGEKNVVRSGSTGAGALIGTTLANNGYITVANSAHAAHPYTAGKLVVRVRGYTP